MCFNVSRTSWAAPAWSWVPLRDVAAHFLQSFAQSSPCYCIMFFIIFCSFSSHSQAHLHLPQLRTPLNRPLWLREMSVHSLIIPLSTLMLTGLNTTIHCSFHLCCWCYGLSLTAAFSCQYLPWVYGYITSITSIGGLWNLCYCYYWLIISNVADIYCMSS